MCAICTWAIPLRTRTTTLFKLCSLSALVANAVLNQTRFLPLFIFVQMRLHWLPFVDEFVSVVQSCQQYVISCTLQWSTIQGNWLSIDQRVGEREIDLGFISSTIYLTTHIWQSCTVVSLIAIVVHVLLFSVLSSCCIYVCWRYVLPWYLKGADVPWLPSLKVKVSHWPLSLTLAILTWLFIISPLSLGKCKLTISCNTHMTFWLKVVTQAEMCFVLRRHSECLWRHSAHLSSKRQTGDSQCTATLMMLCYTCTLPFSQQWVHRHIALLAHTQIWQ